MSPQLAEVLPCLGVGPQGGWLLAISILHWSAHELIKQKGDHHSRLPTGMPERENNRFTGWGIVVGIRAR